VSASGPEGRTRLVRPTAATLPAHVDALQRGWSPDNIRGAAAAAEALERIKADAAGYLALTQNLQGGGPLVMLPDGSQVERLPSLTRWIWDTVDDAFAGSIGLRWPQDRGALPPHVLGHVGYSVAPWQRRRGHATRALALMLGLAREQGLKQLIITTDLDNTPSQRVITANGGVLEGEFDKGPVYGHKRGLRFRIDL
jgi:predicted acetyltransferase